MDTRLFESIFDGAVAVAVKNLVERQGKENVNIDVLQWAGKTVLNGAIDRLLDEWTVAVDAIVSDEALRQFVNAQTVDLGRDIVRVYFDELAWHCYEDD